MHVHNSYSDMHTAGVADIQLLISKKNNYRDCNSYCLNCMFN